MIRLSSSAMGLLLGISVTLFFAFSDKTFKSNFANSYKGHSVETIDVSAAPDDVKPIKPYLKNAIDWLAASQFTSGGWGAGSHSAQNIRDPRAVKIDPATTAFAAMALMRAGNTLEDGPYARNLKKATELLLKLVEETPANASNVTDIKGTQPQAKLGPQIDASMTSQFFVKVRELVDDRDPLLKRINASVDKCITILQNSQNNDGSWSNGGWAPVLQSAMANNALELAEQRGFYVDGIKLQKSKDYQVGNVDTETETIKSDKAAGIALYSASSVQRTTAADAEKVKDIIEEIPEAEIINYSVGELSEVVVTGYGVSRKEAKRMAKAYKANKASSRQLQDDAVLRGFGNNGGEEFLSFMMTSESLVQNGGNDWEKWYQKLDNLYPSIQNNNGSWSGHHCITSPVFCTAAVILSMTVDRDADLKALAETKK